MSINDEVGKSTAEEPNKSHLGVGKDIEVTLVRQPYGMESGVIAEQAAGFVWMAQVLLCILDEVKAIHHDADKTPSEDEGNSTPTDAWMETEDVASYLNLTVKTIREGAARGVLPGHKYPSNSRRGRWRFKRAELDAALNRKARNFKTKGVTAW